MATERPTPLRLKDGGIYASVAYGFNGHGTANTSATVEPVALTGAVIDKFQWPRNGQHLCDVALTPPEKKVDGKSFNGHGTANTSATSSPTGCDAQRESVSMATERPTPLRLALAMGRLHHHRKFQWPRNGQHLCDLSNFTLLWVSPSTVSMATERPTPLRLQVAPTLATEFERFNGHGTANTSATTARVATFLTLNPTDFKCFNGHGTANTSATSGLWVARTAFVRSFQWPRNGQHLCDPVPKGSAGVADGKFQWPRNGQHLCDRLRLG